MRLRHTSLWVLASATAFASVGCGGGGDDDKNPDTTCDGGECASSDGGGAGGKDGAVETPDTCSNGKRDGDEVDVDCGGSCDGCGDGTACSADADCASKLCTMGECAVPSCDDLVQNGAETGIDCGGGGRCQPCDGEVVCMEDGTCGATGGFTLSAGGPSPITITATSTAQRGTAKIAQTRYDWGDGTGSGTAETHEYLADGTYAVQQIVVDVNGLITRTTQSIEIKGGFVPVRMSPTDASTGRSQQGIEVPNVDISDNGYTLEVRGMDEGGSRSDSSVAPGSGVWYFEGERLFDDSLGFWGFGVGSADAPLSTVTSPANQSLGGTQQSFGVFTQGTITSSTDPGHYRCAQPAVNGGWFIPSSNTHYGFVVDYRGATPVLYLITKDPTDTVSVACSVALTLINKPLFVMFAGPRAIVGPEGRVNTGADTENFPFAYARQEITDALTAAAAPAAVANGLVLGFGKTRALEADTAPTLKTPADVSVALGSAVTLKASADDAEEGNLTDKIEWVDRSLTYSQPDVGYGGTFTYTPKGIGKHLVSLSVTDRLGRRTTATVTVNVTGTLEQFTPVRFVDEPGLTGKRVNISADGQSIYFGDEGSFKDAVRVNQGLYGDFWYFEATRTTAWDSMGIGLVVGDVPLNPYSIYDVPLSMSINVTSSVWHNLIPIGNLSVGSGLSDEGAASKLLTRYGFAVDYRGDYPIVHLIVGAGSSGRFIQTIELKDVHVPVYPFVYSGEGEYGDATTPAVTLKFAPPFQFNPAALLQAPNMNIGVDPVPAGDVAALKLRWGASSM